MKQTVYDFVTEFKQNYDDIMDMDIGVFVDMCNYLSLRNKGEKKLTQQQKDMIEKSKTEKLEWEKQK